MEVLAEALPVVLPLDQRSHAVVGVSRVLQTAAAAHAALHRARPAGHRIKIAIGDYAIAERRLGDLVARVYVIGFLPSPAYLYWQGARSRRTPLLRVFDAA